MPLIDNDDDAVVLPSQSIPTSYQRPRKSSARPRKKLDEVPEMLKPYIWHGIDLQWTSHSKHAMATCPYCEGVNKYAVVISTGQANCPKCLGYGGNAGNLGEKLIEKGKTLDGYREFLEDLRGNRKLLEAETLERWGIAPSPVTGEPLVPGFKDLYRTTEGKEGKSTTKPKAPQVYRYVIDPKTGNRSLWATPGFKHGVFGLNLLDVGKERLIICEGIWDGMAVWELLWKTRGFGSYGVVAIPGANSFPECLMPFLSRKEVYLFFDNDHRRRNVLNGSTIAPAGLAGVQRLAGVLSDWAKSVHYLRWGNEEEQYDLSLPHGYDVRDYLTTGDCYDRKERVERLKGLLEKCRPVPQAWVEGNRPDKEKAPVIEPVHCESWDELEEAWKRALHWTDGLSRALAVGLAAIGSTEVVGDQLWVRILSPASSGKSTLCEAWSVTKRFVKAVDTLTGLTSGYQADAEGEEDFSLFAKCVGKTLIVNDGDPILQSANRDKLLSQLRVAYNRVMRTSYGNKTSRDYEDHSMTMILCGTASLRVLDSSELGQRYLDVIIMKRIEDELEDAILLHKALRADQDGRCLRNGKAETRDNPDLVRAKQLTGGFVEWLRTSLHERMNDPDRPLAQTSPTNLVRIARWAKFVAYLRARPSKKQDESEERELASRLVSQLVKLARCLCYVFGVLEVDDRIMSIVRQTAIDTSEGRTLEIVKMLYRAGNEGLRTYQVAVNTGQSEEKEAVILRFLKRIGVVVFFSPSQGGTKGTGRWRLSGKLVKLYEDIFEE